MRINDELVDKVEASLEDASPKTSATEKILVASAIALLPGIINGLLSALSSNKAQTIDTNIIDLTCVVTDDLPQSVRNEYCESLEVIYAFMIRSILSTNTYTSLNSNTKGILKSIPLLTKESDVRFVGNVLTDIYTGIFNRDAKGKFATAVFNEAYMEALEMKYRKLVNEVEKLDIFGLEANEPVFKESRSSNGKYLNVDITYNDLLGKQNKKNVSIGVRVRPKVVTRTEMISFFINRNTSAIDPDKVSVFSFKKMMNNLRGKKLNYKEVIDTAPTLTHLMNKVAGIRKPFVCLLVSQNVADELHDEYKIDLDTVSFASKLYANYPILSIGIYNTNSDSITASLTPNAGFVTRSSSAFNSEIAAYEKQIAELAKNKSYY